MSSQSPSVPKFRHAIMSKMGGRWVPLLQRATVRARSRKTDPDGAARGEGQLIPLEVVSSTAPF